MFRPYRVLAGLMVVAEVWWAALLLYLLRTGQAPLRAVLGALFFVLFFAAWGLYYWRALIVVDRRGLTYRGMVRTRRLEFADIRNVDVMPGPVTVYAVRGRPGRVLFTSLFTHHRRLAELLVQRAGLAPLG